MGVSRRRNLLCVLCEPFASSALKRFFYSILYILQLEAVAPALDVADRGRGEVHRAAQRVGVAVALEETPARGDGLIAIGIDPHHQFGIAGLDWRMDQIAGEHRLVAAAPGADRK